LWYEHFSGDSLDVTNTTAQILLKPGEYRLYTTQKMARSAIGVEEESAMQNQTPSSAAYPSPFTADVTFSVQNLPSNGTVTITVTDLSGKAIWQASAPAQKGEELRVIWPASNQQIPVGMYLYHISAPRFISSGKLIKH
jgi:hypothetical protein